MSKKIFIILVIFVGSFLFFSGDVYACNLGSYTWGDGFQSQRCEEFVDPPNWIQGLYGQYSMDYKSIDSSGYFTLCGFGPPYDNTDCICGTGTIRGPVGNWSGGAIVGPPSGATNWNAYNLTVVKYVNGTVIGLFGTVDVTEGSSPPDTGAVQVQSNLNTTANITGPSNYSYSGTSQIFNDAPLGTYSISGIANIDCYDYTVLAPGATQTISSNGQTIFFIIDYYEDGSCVEPPPPLPCVDDATITNTTLPSSLNLTSGQVYNFSVTFQNSGTTGWFDGNAYSLRQTTGLSINSTAPACALDLPYGHVCPALNVGGLRTWSFDLTAPTTPGAYSFNERMKHTAGYIYRDSDTNMSVSSPGSDIFFGDTLSSTITVSSPFNYSLSNSGNSSVAKSTSDVFVQNSISKTLTAGTGQSVTLSLSPALPAGISYSIANGTCSPNCTSLITFTVTPSAPVGVYPLTVIGSPLDKQTSFNLIVSGSPMTVTCSASPSTALIGQTVRWTAVVSGGTPPFSYSWSGTNIPTSPAPNTNPFDIIYGTIGQKSATVTVTDVDSIQAICSVSTVQINFNPKFEEF